MRSPSLLAGSRTDTAVPRPGCGTDRDLPVVVADDSVHDGQAQAAAFGEAAVKRLEQCIEFLRRDPDAFVLHGHTTPADTTSRSPVSFSRPPFGIARKPFVARFQTICLICPSSASYHSSSVADVDDDLVVGAELRSCCAGGAPCHSGPAARRIARSETAAVARTRETIGSSCSDAPIRAERCPSAVPARC